jgi:hypothetical protein
MMAAIEDGHVAVAASHEHEILDDGLDATVHGGPRGGRSA